MIGTILKIDSEMAEIINNKIIIIISVISKLIFKIRVPIM